jgi:glycosyltransferase involved in cell wall biosynthesis
LSAVLITYHPVDRTTGGYIYNRLIMEALEKKGFRVETIALKPLPIMFAWIHSIPLFRMLKPGGSGKEYDVAVIDEMVHPSVWLLSALASQLKVPLVTLVHSLTSKMPGWNLRKALSGPMEKAVLSGSRLVVANSEYSRNLIESLVDGRVPIRICRPGKDGLVSTEGQPAAGMPEESPKSVSRVTKLFTASHISRLKGLDVLLTALSRLPDLEWRLTIAGDCSVDRLHFRRLQRIIRSGGLQDRIAFTGILKGADLSREYRQADLFVFPTKYEAYGMSLAEAMHIGLPFVASKIGGVEEITQGKGWLFEAGDSTELAAILRKVISNPGLREKSSGLSKELARRLPTWADTGKCFCETIVDCISD